MTAPIVQQAKGLYTVTNASGADMGAHLAARPVSEGNVTYILNSANNDWTDSNPWGALGVDNGVRFTIVGLFPRTVIRSNHALIIGRKLSLKNCYLTVLLPHATAPTVEVVTSLTLIDTTLELSSSVSCMKVVGGLDTDGICSVLNADPDGVNSAVEMNADSRLIVRSGVLFVGHLLDPIHLPSTEASSLRIDGSGEVSIFSYGTLIVGNRITITGGGVAAVTGKVNFNVRRLVIETNRLRGLTAGSNTAPISVLQG